MSTFHKIDQDSVNAITNALSFFEVPSTNVSVSNSSVMELLTLNPVSITPYHFKIHASSNYVDLSKCYVFTEARIKKLDATTNQIVNITHADNVSVCQMFGNSLWKNCRVSINGTQVFEGNSLMAYKSMFDYTLTYPKGVKESYLNVAGYYPDDETSQTTGAGFNARKELFTDSKVAQFMAKLDVDICNQPRYMVNQCEIDIELLPNGGEFCLIAPTAGTTYFMEIVSVKLYVKKLELMDSLAFDINKKLELSPARYPIKKTSIKSLFISENRTEFFANLWADHIPRRVVLAMVANADFVGNLATSPFNFQPFDVRDISIMANGVTYPTSPYNNLDFPNGRYARPFHDFNEAVGLAGSMESNGISYKKYGKGGHAIFAFNLTSSGEDNGPETFDLIRNGTTHVKMTFNSAVPQHGIVLIAMAETDGILMMDRNRTISTDISV